MPYFPRESEQSYRCQGCGGHFVRTGVSCCVAHAPGTCCHLGERPVDPALKQIRESYERAFPTKQSDGFPDVVPRQRLSNVYTWYPTPTNE